MRPDEGPTLDGGPVELSPRGVASLPTDADMLLEYLEDHVEAVVDHLRARFGADVETRTVREEHVSFPLPRELRVLTRQGE